MHVTHFWFTTPMVHMRILRVWRGDYHDSQKIILLVIETPSIVPLASYLYCCTSVFYSGSKLQEEWRKWYLPPQLFCKKWNLNHIFSANFGESYSQIDSSNKGPLLLLRMKLKLIWLYTTHWKDAAQHLEFSFFSEYLPEYKHSDQLIYINLALLWIDSRTKLLNQCLWGNMWRLHAGCKITENASVLAKNAGRVWGAGGQTTKIVAAKKHIDWLVFRHLITVTSFFGEKFTRNLYRKLILFCVLCCKRRIALYMPKGRYCSQNVNNVVHYK